MTDYPIPALTTERELFTLAGELGALGLPLNYSSLALEQQHIVKSGAGTLLGFQIYSDRASSQFIQFFDQEGGTAASAAVPVLIFVVNAKANLPMDFGPYGRFFQQGIIVANSTTAATQTAGSADCWFDVQYV